jgi:putative phosphoesterase
LSCIEFLRREPRLLRVRGNHDNAVAFRMNCGCGEAYLHLSTASREYMWQVLGEEDLAWIGEPGTSLQLESGGRSILAVHAAPSDNLFKYVTPETTDEELAAEAELTGADIILMGHTHRPFRREAGGKLLVNVGSVGQPRDGIPMASYALIENGEVELKRVAYDVGAAVAKVRALPLDKQVIAELVHILEHAGMPG